MKNIVLAIAILASFTATLTVGDLIAQNTPRAQEAVSGLGLNNDQVNANAAQGLNNVNQIAGFDTVAYVSNLNVPENVNVPAATADENERRLDETEGDNQVQPPSFSKNFVNALNTISQLMHNEAARANSTQWSNAQLGVDGSRRLQDTPATGFLDVNTLVQNLNTGVAALNDAVAQGQAAANDAAAQVQPVVDDAAAQGQTVVDDASAQGQTVVDDASAQVQPVVDDASAQVQPVVDDASAQGQTVVDDASAQVQPVVDDASAQVQPVVDDASAQTQPVIDDASAQGQTVVDDASAQVQPVVDNVSLQLHNNSAETLNKARETVALPEQVNTYNPVNSPAFHSLNDNLSNEYNNLLTVASGERRLEEGEGESSNNLNVGEQIVAAAHANQAQVKNVATDAQNNASQAASSVNIDNIKADLSNATNQYNAEALNNLNRIRVPVVVAAHGA